MQIIFDKDKCMKSGECYYNHPEILNKGDDGYPIVIAKEISTPELHTHATQAIDVCPAAALFLG